MEQRLIDANDINVEDTIGGRNEFADCIRDSVECVLNNAPTVFTIPENPTNGDIIKAIFNISDSEIDEGLSTTYIYTKTRVLKGGSQDHLREQITFNREWWNAPYKKGDASE